MKPEDDTDELKVTLEYKITVHKKKDDLKEKELKSKEREKEPVIDVVTDEQLEKLKKEADEIKEELLKIDSYEPGKSGIVSTDKSSIIPTEDVEPSKKAIDIPLDLDAPPFISKSEEILQITDLTKITKEQDLESLGDHEIVVTEDTHADAAKEAKGGLNQSEVEKLQSEDIFQEIGYRASEEHIKKIQEEDLDKLKTEEILHDTIGIQDKFEGKETGDLEEKEKDVEKEEALDTEKQEDFLGKEELEYGKIESQDQLKKEAWSLEDLVKDVEEEKISIEKIKDVSEKELEYDKMESLEKGRESLEKIEKYDMEEELGKGKVEGISGLEVLESGKVEMEDKLEETQALEEVEKEIVAEILDEEKEDIGEKKLFEYDELEGEEIEKGVIEEVEKDIEKDVELEEDFKKVEE